MLSSSEAGIDGQFTLDLTSALAAFTPHPNQGYHVNLIFAADDGTHQGSDGASKAFWVGSSGATTTTATLLGLVALHEAEVVAVAVHRAHDSSK